MRFALRFHALLVPALAAAGCGTHVDAGDNLDRSKARALDAQQADPPVGGGGADAGGDGSADAGGLADGGGDSAGGGDGGGGTPGTGGGGSGGAPLTCFGPAPALPAGFQAFCDGADDVLKTRFAKALDLVCNQHRGPNLRLQPCSWQGDGVSDKFRRVLDKTALTDTATTDFEFFAAYGVTSQSKLEDHVALIFREMTDPSYDEVFVKIRNSRIYDVVANADGSFDYTADLASSAAIVSFRAHLEARKITDDLTAVLDYATGGQVILKEHRFLRFLVRLDDGHTRMIGIDEKLIGDGGNHTVAYQNLTDVLKQRMERDYENSRRD